VFFLQRTPAEFHAVFFGVMVKRNEQRNKKTPSRPADVSQKWDRTILAPLHAPPMFLVDLTRSESTITFTPQLKIQFHSNSFQLIQSQPAN